MGKGNLRGLLSGRGRLLRGRDVIGRFSIWRMGVNKMDQTGFMGLYYQLRLV